MHHHRHHHRRRRPRRRRLTSYRIDIAFCPSCSRSMISRDRYRAGWYPACSVYFCWCDASLPFCERHRALSFVGCAQQQQTHVQTRRGQCSRSGDAPLLQSHTYRASSHARQRATRHDGRRAPASAEQQMPDGLHGSWHARLELDVRLCSYQAATPITRSRSRVTQRGQRQEKKRQSVSSCGEARASLSESSVRVPRQRTYMCTVPSAQCPVPSSVHWTTGEGCRLLTSKNNGTPSNI